MPVRGFRFCAFWPIRCSAAFDSGHSGRTSDRREEQASAEMTGDESRKLKVGDRVNWSQNQNDQGTIKATNWSGVSLKWDNREEQSVLHNDMALVFLTSKK